jgi:hypothetical protein
MLTIDEKVLFEEVADRCFGGHPEEVVPPDEQEDYHHPRALFFGAVPEERYDVRFLPEDLYNGWEWTNLFEYLENRVSVRVEIGNEPLEPKFIRMVDHLYGCMVQQSAKRKADDMLMLDIGMLSVETETKMYEQAMLVGTGLFNQIGGALRNLKRLTPRAQLDRIHRNITESCRWLIPAPNIHLIDKNLEEAYRPMVNFDMGFSGYIGWYRFERAAQQVIPGFELGFEPWKRTKAKIYVDQKMRVIEHSLECVEDMMHPKGYKKLQELLEETKEVYL